MEIWFSKIERDVIARGVFTSVSDLRRKLMNYIKRYNDAPRPIKWSYVDVSRRITGPTSSNTLYVKNVAVNAVLDSWLEALGGRDAVGNVAIVHMTGTVTAGTLTGTFERWATSRGELRTDINLAGAFRKIVAFDGHRGWWRENDRAALELSGEVLEGAITVSVRGQLFTFLQWANARDGALGGSRL